MFTTIGTHSPLATQAVSWLLRSASSLTDATISATPCQCYNLRNLSFWHLGIPPMLQPPKDSSIASMPPGCSSCCNSPRGVGDTCITTAKPLSPPGSTLVSRHAKVQLFTKRDNLRCTNNHFSHVPRSRLATEDPNCKNPNQASRNQSREFQRDVTSSGATRQAPMHRGRIEFTV